MKWKKEQKFTASKDFTLIDYSLRIIENHIAHRTYRLLTNTRRIYRNISVLAQCWYYDKWFTSEWLLKSIQRSRYSSLVPTLFRSQHPNSHFVCLDSPEIWMRRFLNAKKGEKSRFSLLAPLSVRARFRCPQLCTQLFVLHLDKFNSFPFSIAWTSGVVQNEHLLHQSTWLNIDLPI